MVNWRCLMQGHRWWPIGVTNRHVVYRCRVCAGAKKKPRDRTGAKTLVFRAHKKASE